MDDYSVQVIRLYMERNKSYLVRVLRRYMDDVPNDITEETAIRLLVATTQRITCPAPTRTYNSSIYKCYRCRSTNVSIREVQLRSADEGSSVLCHCNGCGHNSVY